MIAISNFASLPASQFDPLRQLLVAQTSMEKALAWYFSQTPPLTPEDMVTQDEFSYDLLVPYPGSLYLSYDTN